MFPFIHIENDLLDFPIGKDAPKWAGDGETKIMWFFSFFSVITFF